MPSVFDVLNNAANGAEEPLSPVPAVPKGSVSEALETSGAGKLRTIATYGAQKSPDTASRVISLQSRTGLPAEFVENNIDALEEKIRDANFDADDFKKNSPIYSSWLEQNPNHWAASTGPNLGSFWSGGSDVNKMSYIERQVKSVSSQFRSGMKQTELVGIGKSAFFGKATEQERTKQLELEADMASLTHINYGLAGFLEGAPSAVANQLPIFGRNIAAQAQGYVVGGTMAGTAGAVSAGAAAAPTLNPAVIGTAAAGGFVATFNAGGIAGARIASGIEAAETEAFLSYLDYEKLKDENGNPLSRETIVAASAIVGVVNGSLEALALGKLTKNIPGISNLTRGGFRKMLAIPSVRQALTKFGREVIEGMATEGSTEFMQELVTKSAGKIAQLVSSGTELSPTEIMNAIINEENISAAIESGRAGMQSALGIGGGGATYQLTKDLRQQKRDQAMAIDTSKRAEVYLDNVQAVAQDLKLKEKNPDVVKALVKEMGEAHGTQNLYVDAKDFTEYFQSKNIDPQQAADELLGQTSTQYQDVLANGGQLAIPMENFVVEIASSEHVDFFKQNSKLDPIEMSAKEREAFIKEAETQDLTADIQDPNALRSEQELRQFSTATQDQLIAAGRPITEAEFGSEIFAAGFSQFAEAEGKTIQEFSKQFNVSIGDTMVPLSVGDTVYNQGPVVTNETRLELSTAIGDNELLNLERDYGRISQQNASTLVGQIKNGTSREQAVAGFRASAGQAADAVKVRASESVLKNAPKNLKASKAIRQMEADYAADVGKAYRPQTEYVTVAPETAKKIADAFEAMEHNPNDAEVKASYNAMINETLAQYQIIKRSGLKITAITEDMENPYPNGSADMIADVRDNNHLWFFPTDLGFGTDSEHYSDNPMLAPTKEVIDGIQLVANDVFRIVHDVFGHAKEGFGYGPIGEENAWRSHVKMYSPLAAQAMTTETRGQNSWVNYGPNAESNRANPANTIYAPQKVGILPEFAMADGYTELFQDDINDSLQGKRGGIMFDNDGNFRIRFGKDADASTFIHETGHLFIEMLSRLAEGGSKNLRIQNDWQIIKDHLGIQNRSQLTRDHHERLAEMFEQYVMEGKSPNSLLRRAFASYKRWMTKIYKRIKNRAILNDDIRRVFDRVLAAQEEIDSTSAYENIVPAIENPIEAGVSEADAKRLDAARTDVKLAAEERMSRQLLKNQTRAKRAAWEKRYKEVYAQINLEVGQMPVYAAIDNMTVGLYPDGTKVEPENRIKLSKEALLQMYGNNTFGRKLISKLPRPYIYTTKEDIALHPDKAAEFFGFPNGDAMIQAILRAENKESLVDRKTNDVLVAEFGETFLDGSTKQEALKQVYSKKLSNLLRLELEILAKTNFTQFKKTVKLVNRPVPTVEAVREQAELFVKRMNHRQINPHSFQAAAKKASKEAMDLFLKGDINGAFEAKKRQLINTERFRAARLAKERLDKNLRFVRKLENPKLRAKIGKAENGYLEQINDIMLRFSFNTDLTLPGLERQKQFREYYEEQKKNGIDIPVDQKILNDAYKVNYKDMPSGELDMLFGTLKSIVYNAREQFKLQTEHGAKELELVGSMFYNSVEANWKIKDTPVDHTPGQLDEFWEVPESWLAQHEKIEPIAEALDGGEFNGMAYTYIVRPINLASDREKIMIDEFGKKMHSIMSVYTAKEKRESFFKSRLYIEEIGETLSLEARIAVALNTTNEDNYQKLMDGGSNGKTWNSAQVQAIVNTLDARDIQVVNEIIALADIYWPQIAALHKRVTGLEPTKVQGRPFQASAGTINGGYYPIMYDNRQSDRQAELDEETEIKSMFAGQYARAMTQQGHTEQRVKYTGRALRLSLEPLERHYSNVIHDITHREAVINVSKFLKNESVKKAIQGSLGKEVYKQFNPWLLAVANATRTTPGDKGAKLANSARNGVTFAYLGWKTMTAILQTSGYVFTVKELGPKYAYIGLKKFFNRTSMSKQKILDSIFEKSVMMRHRAENITRDINEIFKNLKIGASASPGQITELVHAIEKKFGTDFATEFAATATEFGSEVSLKSLFLIQYMDMMVSAPTWLGAYEKALAGEVTGAEKGNSTHAAEYADKIVRDTQGAGEIKDLSNIQRGSAWFKLLTMFSTEGIKVYNQFKKTHRQYQLTGDTNALLQAAIWGWFAPAILEGMIRGGPEGEEPEDYAKFFGKKIAQYPFNAVMIVRDIMNFDYQYSASSGFKYMQSYRDLGRTAIKGATGDKELTRNDYKNAFMAAGIITKMPASQAWTSSEYFYDWMTGAEDPNAVEGIYRTLTVGKEK